MIKATVILILLVLSGIILYGLLSQPLYIMLDALSDSYPSEDSEEQVQGDLGMLNVILGGAAVVLIVSGVAWYALYVHRREYERY